MCDRKSESNSLDGLVGVFLSVVLSPHDEQEMLPCRLVVVDVEVGEGVKLGERRIVPVVLN